MMPMHAPMTLVAMAIAPSYQLFAMMVIPALMTPAFLEIAALLLWYVMMETYVQMIHALMAHACTLR